MTALVGSCALILVVLLGYRARPLLRARAVPIHARRRKPMWLLFIIPAGLVSPMLGVAVALFPPLWKQWFLVRRRASMRRRISTEFPDALDLLVLSIRAGYMPAQSIVEITPYLPRALRPAFGAVDEAMRRGSRFADALEQLSVRLGPVARPLVDSLSAADRYGLPLAPVLERLSFEARQQRRRDTDAAARELPVRLAMPLVLCTLPSFVLLAIVPLLLGALSSLHT